MKKNKYVHFFFLGRVLVTSANLFSEAASRRLSLARSAAVPGRTSDSAVEVEPRLGDDDITDCGYLEAATSPLIAVEKGKRGSHLTPFKGAS